jgi:hypothetical protein
MSQFIYNDLHKGKPRTLLILKVAETEEYRVFCESVLLGILRAERGSDGSGILWKTEYNILKPIAGKIGLSIAAASQAV